MAWAFRSAGSVATGVNPTPALPSGWQPGDLLILVCAYNDTSAEATYPIAGWNITTPQTATGAVFGWRIATAGMSAPTILTTNSTAKAGIVAYTGVGLVVEPRVATGVGGTSGTQITTTFANDLLVHFYYAGHTSASTANWTADAATTSRLATGCTTSLYGFLIADENVASAGSITGRTATLSRSVTPGISTISYAFITSHVCSPPAGTIAVSGEMAPSRQTTYYSTSYASVTTYYDTTKFNWPAETMTTVGYHAPSYGGQRYDAFSDGYRYAYFRTYAVTSVLRIDSLTDTGASYLRHGGLTLEGYRYHGKMGYYAGGYTYFAGASGLNGAIIGLVSRFSHPGEVYSSISSALAVNRSSAATVVSSTKGYILGGSTNFGYTSYIEGLTFSSETVGTVSTSTTVDAIRTSELGSSTKGYSFQVSGTAIRGFTFSSETYATLSATSSHSRNDTGYGHSTTAAYIFGGRIHNTTTYYSTIDAVSFADDTSSVLGLTSYARSINDCVSFNGRIAVAVTPTVSVSEAPIVAAPSAATANVTGFAPTPTEAAIFLPDSGSMQAIGEPAAITAAYLISVGNGVVGATGHAPEVVEVAGGGGVIAVPVGAMIFGGFAPAGQMSTPVYPEVGEMAVSTAPPEIMIQHIIPTGEVGVSFVGESNTAVVEYPRTSAPEAAQLATATYAPTISVNVSPTTRAVAFSGQQPTPSVDHRFYPTEHAVSFTGFTAYTRVGITLQHTPLVASTYAPAVALSLFATSRPVYFSGHIPVVSKSGSLAPSERVVTLTGYAPSVRAELRVATTETAATVTGYVPTLLRTAVQPVVARDVSLIGHAPKAVSNHITTPSENAIVVVGAAPTASQKHIFYPDTAGLSVSRYAPLYLTDDINAVVSGAVAISGHIPVAFLQWLATPDSGQLLTTGYEVTLDTAISYGDLRVVMPPAGVLAVVGMTPWARPSGAYEEPALAVFTAIRQQVVYTSVEVIDTTAYVLILAQEAPVYIADTYARATTRRNDVFVTVVE